MKKNKIFIITITLLISAVVSAQIDYPFLTKDTNGNTIITMTEKQAQTLDNMTDLEQLFEKANIQYNIYDSICLKLINQKNDVITSQKIEIKNLLNQVEIKNDENNILIKENDVYKQRDSINTQQNNILNQMLKQKDKTIKSNLIKMWIGGVSGGVVIVTLMTLLLL